MGIAESQFRAGVGAIPAGSNDGAMPSERLWLGLRESYDFAKDLS